MVEVEVHKPRLRNLPVGKREPLIIAGIPAFNEEKTIARVVLQAQRFVDRVVVCDDGSTDLTSEIAKRLGAEIIRHGKNLGYGRALQSLFRRARESGADVLVTLDGDGQHNTSEIPLLTEPVVEGKADVVIGSRFLSNGGKGNGMPRYRRVGVKVITGLSDAACNHGLSDAQSGFRVYGRKALEGLSLCEDGMGASVEILMEAKKNGLNIVEVQTGCNYNNNELEKTSTSNPLGHGASVVMSIVRLVVEDRPLLFLGLPGAFSVLVGVLFGVWMLQIYSMQHMIETNIALASMAFTLVGLFAVFTAITLYAIARLMQKMNRH